MEQNTNPYEGYFQKLGESLPKEIVDKLIITDDETSEDYNKTYLQKIDEYLSKQHELIQELHKKDDESNQEQIEENSRI